MCWKVRMMNQSFLPMVKITSFEKFVSLFWKLDESLMVKRTKGVWMDEELES